MCIRDSRYTLVDTIVSAADALMVCGAKHIDLILMDINTAKNESGIEATRRIKKSFPTIKIIVTTSYTCLLYTSFLGEGCRAGTFYMAISAKGDFMPCPHLIDTGEKYLSIKEYWNKDRKLGWYRENKTCFL